MNSRGYKVTAVTGGTLALAAVVLLGGLIGCRTASSGNVHPVGDSFFPLARGNQWVFAVTPDDQDGLRDTVRIDAVSRTADGQYYRLRASWPGFAAGRWVHRTVNGNVVWVDRPGGNDQPFLNFDANVGSRWSTAGAMHECVDTLVMLDNYAAVRTPYGLFDGARSFGSSPSCTDFGWGISAARGIGPTTWTAVTIAGAQEWVLVAALVHDDAEGAESAPRLVNGN